MEARDLPLITAERTEVDGIPTYVADAPAPFRGALIFRVGMADEQLPQLGTTHIAEHLAIFPFGRATFPYGGFVDESRTVFFAHGTQVEVCDYLAAVCRNLRSLPFDRLDQERRVLRSESQQSAGGHALWRLRFGPAGYGLASYAELGLEHVSAGQVESWVGERFTRQNAVLWFSGGPPPESLELDLPDGDRRAPVEPHPIPDLRIPCYATESEDIVGISMLGRRSTALSAGTAILHEAMQEHLRRELGLTYSVGGGYWRLTPEAAHISLLADSTPGHARAVRDGLLGVLDRISESGPTQEELELELARAERFWSDPENAPAWLDGVAAEELTGGPSFSPQQLLAERRGLTPDEIATAVAEAAESIILCLPPGVGVGDGRAAVWGDGWVHEPIEGERYNFDDGSGAIVIGEEGISSLGPNMRTMTVRFEDCCLVVLAGDYAVSVFDERGEFVHFEFTDPAKRSSMLEPILAAVDPSLIARVDQDVGERQKAVLALAREGLGEGARGAALNSLARVMQDGETALRLSWARLDGEDGLLALTDLRLMHFERKTGTFRLDLPLQLVTAVSTRRRMLRQALVVSLQDGTVELESISAKGGAQELAGAVDSVRATTS